MLGELTDGLLGRVEKAADAATRLFEPTLRLGVTGLSGAGKTVFITSLVASLLRRGRMTGLAAEAEGRLLAAMLSPQPDPAVPRFAYERHVAALTGEPRTWPESTRAISQLRISLRYRPAGFIGGMWGTSSLHLDIVDYPGEWLADLALMEKSYAAWSAEALSLAETERRRALATGWLEALRAADPAAPHAEPAAEALMSAYAAYLRKCRGAGLSALPPGRFLMPGDLEGSPALTFAPLPRPENPARDSLWREMAARYEAYKRHVVRPFFQDHFAALDRQVVVVDALGALAAGPGAFGDLVTGMTTTLSAFRHGSSSWLDRLLGGRKIDRLLFASTKADHLHHEQHGRLTAITEAMLAEAAAKAAFGGAEIRAMAVAAVRATVEQEVRQGGKTLKVVRGTRLDTRREAAVFPGRLPSDPRPLFAATADPTRTPADWPDAAYASIRFAPPAWGPEAGDGPPHIRLDRAIDFLIGDRLE